MHNIVVHGCMCTNNRQVPVITLSYQLLYKISPSDAPKFANSFFNGLVVKGKSKYSFHVEICA